MKKLIALGVFLLGLASPATTPDYVMTNARVFNTGAYANNYATGGNGTSGSPWTSASGTGGICEAIAAAPAGGTVFLPAGFYAITATCTVTKAIHVAGYGRGFSSLGTTLVAETGLSGPVFLVQPQTSSSIDGWGFSSFNITPASGAPGTYGIELDGTNAKILDGLIERVNIYQLGGPAIGAIGTGGAQGNPVLTTIRDSVLWGGFVCAACGDSVKLVRDQLTGAGTSSFAFQSGAAGFAFAYNNVTQAGGIHFGSGAVTPQIEYNDMSVLSGFVGSNGAFLDIDGAAGGDGYNVRDAIIVGNTISTSGGVAAIRLNYSKGAVLVGNYLNAAAASGCDVDITANATADLLLKQYFYTTSTAYNVCNASTGEAQFYAAQGLYGLGMTTPDGQATYAVDSTDGSVNPVLRAHSGVNYFLAYHGASGLVLGNGNVSIYDGSASNNLAAYVADGATSSGLSTATWLNLANLNVVKALDTTNCQSAASPAVCGADAAGMVAVPVSSTTLVVDTSLVTANSEIFLTFDSSLGSALGVTCNATLNQPSVSARTAGTSFTITMAASVATSPDCLSYRIIN